MKNFGTIRKHLNWILLLQFTSLEMRFTQFGISYGDVPRWHVTVDVTRYIALAQTLLGKPSQDEPVELVLSYYREIIIM